MLNVQPALNFPNDSRSLLKKKAVYRYSFKNAFKNKMNSNTTTNSYVAFFPMMLKLLRIKFLKHIHPVNSESDVAI